MQAESLSIDAQLLTSYLDQLHAIGALPEGGVWRPVYSPAWEQACRLVEGWMRDAGLTVRQDTVGNLFGRLDGNVSGPAIMVGSHIDSVYAGGRFDGALGVVGAILAVRALKDLPLIPRRSVEVFVSCEEEDSRFICDFWGSRAILGHIQDGEADRYLDSEGVRMSDAMRSVGLDPARIREAARQDIAAFLELHIEQGPVLDQEGIALGVVEAISGVNRIAVRIEGKADHAGTTPMALRADALLGAADIVRAMRRLADETGEPARVTVGRLSVYPSQANIVAGAVDLIVDCRHSDRSSQERLRDESVRKCQESARGGLRIVTEVLVDQPPTAMDAGLVNVLESAAGRRGHRFRRMVSGAGHDSQILGRRIPTAMIFVPSRDGRSHSPAEFTPDEQLLPGVEVLAEALAVVTSGNLPV